MITNGIKPVKKDHRDRSFHRTFGATVPPIFPESFNIDNGFGFPDQNADGLFEGCTGYSQSEICMDEDKQKYLPSYTYDKTLFMEGQERGQPCNFRDSLKSLILWGPSTDGTDYSASKNRRGAYYMLEKNSGLDWFDTFRQTLLVNVSGPRSISVASPWFSQWSGSNVGPEGVLITLSDYSWQFGHNWKNPGWETVGAVPYVLGKTWQGPNYGHQGWARFSRENINAIMEVPGAAAAIVFKEDPANPDDVQLVKLTILDWVESYTRILLSRLGKLFS